MNPYVIQRISDGLYVAQRFGDLIPDPHAAYTFCSRESAQAYIRRYMPAAEELYRAAVLPATRTLLSLPVNRSRGVNENVS